MARAASILDGVEAGTLDAGVGDELAARIFMDAYREADAITYSEDSGLIEVEDVYRTVRGQEGMSRSDLGGSFYERLLYTAESDELAIVGYRSPDDTTGSLREGILSGTEDWAGFSIDWSAMRSRDLGEPSAIVWMFRPDERGDGFGPGGPQDTAAHEVAIHVYRQFAGMDATHGCHHSPVPCAAGAIESGADVEAHWSWSFDPGEAPPSPAHRRPYRCISCSPRAPTILGRAPV